MFTGEVFMGTARQCLAQMNSASRFPHVSHADYAEAFAERAAFFIKTPILSNSPEAFFRSLEEARMATIIIIDGEEK